MGEFNASTSQQFCPVCKTYRSRTEFNRDSRRRDGLYPYCKGCKRELRLANCHESGKVRALLCDGCNRGLGSFKVDPARLPRAIEYLIRLQQE
ncbi:MAG: hypothetical protein H0T57_04040 [Rubrobacter sp.]|nr:hypothetical protein [Rubrobacter sp.]